MSQTITPLSPAVGTEIDLRSEKIQSPIVSHVLRFILIFITLCCWALWLGGTIATFVFAKHFFAVFPHDTAADSANAMFHVFAKYELGLTATTILACGLLLVTYPSKWLVLLLGVLVLAGGMVILVALGFMPAMDSLLAEGKHAEYLKLHIKSMIAMTIQSGLLVLGGAILMLTREK